MKPHFERVWQRILAHEGEIFHTKTGCEFHYRIEGSHFIQDRTKWNITKQDFEKAFACVPIDGPGGINSLVQGPAYVWAVLHDPRISSGEW